MGREQDKCPKCGGEMKPGSLGLNFRILKPGDLSGDPAVAFYCQECGFVELYKEPSTKEPKRWSRRVQEQEQLQQPASVEEPRKPREKEVDKRLIR